MRMEAASAEGCRSAWGRAEVVRQLLHSALVVAGKDIHSPLVGMVEGCRIAVPGADQAVHR